MGLVDVDKLTFTYENEGLYKSVSFSLQFGEHACLVGKNGSGKSTFMKLLADKLTPDSGTITWLNGIKYSYLDQQLEVKTDISIRDYLYGVYKELFDREERLNNLYLEASLEDGETQEELFNKAEELRLSLEMDNFYQIEPEINNCIVGLGLANIDLSRRLKELSGGEKAKVYLCKILLEKPDVILMDEPTNFLDKTHIEWLENYLNNFKGAFLIISHDNEFLRSIAKVVYSLDSKDIVRYKGTYDYYLAEREKRIENQAKSYERQQEFIKRTQVFIQKNIVRASTTKMAQSRRKMLEKLERIEKPESAQKIFIHFPFSRALGEKVLNIKDLEIGYNNVPLLEPLTFSIKRGERVEIIGRNGIGKSTLLKTLLNVVDKISGDFEFGPTVDINYFSQEEDIDLSINSLDYVRLYYPLYTVNDCMKTLSCLGIGGDLAFKPLNELSGGQLERVRLSVLTKRKSNVLILDEPTNHLDKATKDALREALAEYEGSIILVSHEKGFAEDLVDYTIKF